MSDKANSRLYGYRAMAKQSFDRKFQLSRSISNHAICILRVYRLILSAFLPQFLKYVIDIHENKNQMSYKL